MAQITLPESPGNLLTLMQALERMYRYAGRPSLRAIEKALPDVIDGKKAFSYGSIHTLFSKSTQRAPRWQVLEGVMTVLANLARGRDVDVELDRFHGMWVAADQKPFKVQHEVVTIFTSMQPDTSQPGAKSPTSSVELLPTQPKRGTEAEGPPAEPQSTGRSSFVDGPALKALLQDFDDLVTSSKASRFEIGNLTGANERNLVRLLDDASLPPRQLLLGTVRALSAECGLVPIIQLANFEGLWNAAHAEESSSQGAKAEVTENLSDPDGLFQLHRQISRLVENADNSSYEDMARFTGFPSEKIHLIVDDYDYQPRANDVRVLAMRLTERYPEMDGQIADFREAERLWEKYARK